ncbi:MAG: peptidylprolyl isomerase [Candidatus Micrarchaeia archaeon]
MVQVKKGDLVRIEYTGKLASNGSIFETTDGNLARDIGIFQEKNSYGPKLAAFGTNTIMVGLEEAILSSTLGKEEEFSIVPEKAFGEKSQDMVRMMPMRDFVRQQVQPVPGRILMLDGVAAKVKSVSAGRVVVDFNHPLAGESVRYNLKVNEVISEPEEKIKALLLSLAVKGDVSKNGKGFVVSFPKTEDAVRVQAAKNAIDVIVPGTKYQSS